MNVMSAYTARLRPKEDHIMQVFQHFGIVMLFGALVCLATARSVAGDFQSAAEACEAGKARAKNMDLDGAIAAYTEAIRLDGKDAQTHLLRGAAYGHKQEHARAISDMDEAIRLDPKLVEAHFVRAVEYQVTGKTNEAIAGFSEAIRLNAQLFQAYNNRGGAYAKLGDREKAIADYTEAIRIALRDPAAYFNRSMAYAQKGDYDKAVADLTEVIQFAPGTSVHIATAACYMDVSINTTRRLPTSRKWFGSIRRTQRDIFTEARSTGTYGNMGRR